MSQSHILEPDQCVWIPAATPGSSAPSAPRGSAGWAAWTASSWAWNSPGQEELPPLDLDLVLETLEEMLSPSLPERSPCAQVTPLGGNERGWAESCECCCMAEKQRLLGLSFEWTGKDFLGQARFQKKREWKVSPLSEDERCEPVVARFGCSFCWEESLVQGPLW